jgi:hypothetical protein
MDLRPTADSQGDPIGAGDRDNPVNTAGKLGKVPIGESIGESVPSWFENAPCRAKGPCLGPG